MFLVLTNFAGFVSIDCGSSTTYNDTNGITWVPDTGYTFTGRNYVTNSTTTNPLHNLRYFPENRDKNCYVLPATPNNFYMVRVSFLYPDFLNSSFRLEMEAQLAATITFQANSSTIPQVYEAYLSTTRDTIYVCLARSTTADVPFMSSLELRPLDTNNMYKILAQGNYLYNNFHANFGSPTPIIRFFQSALNPCILFSSLTSKLQAPKTLQVKGLTTQNPLSSPAGGVLLIQGASSLIRIIASSKGSSRCFRMVSLI